MLKGLKTYLVSAFIALLGVALKFHWITPEQYQWLVTILGGLGLAAARAAIGKAISSKTVLPK